MTAVAPPPVHGSTTAHSPHTAQSAGHDPVAFAAVLDHLSVAALRAPQEKEDRPETQNSGEGPKAPLPPAQVDLQSAFVESALSSLFAVPTGRLSSEEGRCKEQSVQRGAAPDPVVEAASMPEPACGAPPASTRGGPDSAAGAKLVGARSFLAPAAFNGAFDAPFSNPETVARASSPDAREPGSFDDGLRRAVASAPSKGRPDETGVVSMARSEEDAAATQVQPPAPRPRVETTALHHAAAVGRASAGRLTGSSPGAAGVVIPGSTGAPVATGGAAGSESGGAAAGFPGQTPNGGPIAQSLAQPSAIEIAETAAAHAEVAAPRPASPSPSYTPLAAPVREIDLDLSPVGLEDVSMTMRLAGDRLNVLIRAANSQTAVSIEAAREAIAERLGAIGQPLGSFIIQQTGPTDGTTNANAASRDDGQRPQGQGDRGDLRGGRRGSSGF